MRDNNPKVPEKQQRPLTRRDILKLLAIAVPAAALSFREALARGITLEPPPPADIATNVIKEFHSYSGEAANMINHIYNRYGIGIFSLKEQNGKPNLKWPTEAIAKIQDTFLKLPPDYINSKRKPQFIFLVCVPGSKGGGIGGGYASHGVNLAIPEDFSLSAPLTGWAQDIFKTTEAYMEGSICHELTHAFMDDNFLMNFWVKDTGWVKLPSGKWANNKPQDIPPELLLHYAEPSPDEDIAISAARMLVNPSTLSRSRQLFFLATPPFSYWQASIDFANATRGKK